MHNKKFVIGFLAFDVIAIIAVVLYVIIANPFSNDVAPKVTPTSQVTASTNPSTKKKETLSKVGELSMESMQVLSKEPSMFALKEESEKTEDGLYFLEYKGYTESDVDGDGENEYFSISLDKPSSSFYFLARKGETVVDFVIPGNEYSVKEAYGANACKGEIRGFMVDLNSNDKYIEIGVILMRDNWQEYDTIIGRFDGTSIKATVVHGFLSGVSDSSSVQFATYDTIYGVHKLYRNYTITDDADLLNPQGDYFTELNVEKTSFQHILDFDVMCTNLNGDDVTLHPGSPFYWARTDNETFVDVITEDGYVYRLPVRKEVVHYESGDQTVYFLGDKYASDIYAKA